MSGAIHYVKRRPGMAGGRMVRHGCVSSQGSVDAVLATNLHAVRGDSRR